MQEDREADTKSTMDYAHILIFETTSDSEQAKENFWRSATMLWSTIFIPL